jgi:predicted nucleic acid-binding protein
VPIVLDASIALKWFLADERNGFAERLLDRVMIEGALVPALFRWEMASVLLQAERASRIDADDVDAAFDLFRDLPIVIDRPGERVSAGSELALARHFDLTPYDAAYLALAASARMPLATLDGDLVRAARDMQLDVISE